MGFITKNEKLERGEFGFFVPTQVKFGLGKVVVLANELQVEDDLASRNSVLVVTDKGVVGAGLIEKVKTGLADSIFQIKAIFDEVPSDSDLGIVSKCAKIVKEQGTENCARG